MKLKIIITLVMLLSMNTTMAEINPSFGVNKHVFFGSTLFVPGNCIMDHKTGQFTSSNPSTMCGVYGLGTPGHYVIISEPNSTVNIKVLQRNNDGDGITFIPTGEIISDVETLTISANTSQQVNSGVSGVVNIYIGGQLYVNNALSPSSTIQIFKEEGIEWSVSL